MRASKMRCDTSAATASRCNVPRRARSAGPANRPPDQDRADRSPAVRKPARPGRHALIHEGLRQPAVDQKPQPHRPKPPASPLVGPERDRRQARQWPKGVQPQRRRGLADRAAAGKAIADAERPASGSRACERILHAVVRNPSHSFRIPFSCSIVRGGFTR